VLRRRFAPRGGAAARATRTCLTSCFGPAPTSSSSSVDVSYQSEPLLGFLVPIEMRERYDGRDKSHIDGVATYGRFRQFHVNTTETFLIKR